jgi:TRAP-type C4-dicarboxylate transport system substrate-binding protein
MVRDDDHGDSKRRAFLKGTAVAATFGLSGCLGGGGGNGGDNGSGDGSGSETTEASGGETTEASGGETTESTGDGTTQTSGEATETSGGETTETSGGTTGTAAQNTMTLQVNSPASEGSVHGDAGAWVGDIVSERTNGAIEIEAFRNSELGGQAQSVQDVSSGALDMYVIPYALTAIVDQREAQVFDTPYMYDPDNPYEDIYEKTDPQDSEIAKRVIDNLAEQANIRSLGAVAQGTRRVSLTVPDGNEPPSNPDMLSNYTMRAVPISMYAEALKGLGAQTTNIDFSELPQALATGSVDGQENPYNIILSSQIYESQTHVIETDHMHTPLAVLMNQGVFENLTGKQQQIFYDAVREIQPRATENLNQNIESIKRTLRDSGITIVPPDEIEYDVYRSATRERIRNQFSDLTDTIESLAYDNYQP